MRLARCNIKPHVETEWTTMPRMSAWPRLDSRDGVLISPGLARATTRVVRDPYTPYAAANLIPAAAPQHLAARPYAEDAACTCLQLGSLAASLFRSTWSGAPQAPKLQCVYEARGYSETRTYCKVGANDAAAVQRVECNLRHIRSSVFYCSCSTNAPGSVRLMLSNLAHAYAVVR